MIEHLPRLLFHILLLQQVWTIRQEEIHCIQVHDVKEGVVALAANASVACFSSQGNGVKV